MSHRIKDAFLLILISGLGFVSGVIIYIASTNDVTPGNSWMGAIYIGEKTRSEAVSMLTEFDGTLRRKSVKVEVGNVQRVISGDEIGLGIDFNDAKVTISRIMGSYGLVDKVRHTFGGETGEIREDLPLEYDDDRLNQICRGIISSIERKSVDARYDFARNEIIPEQTGTSINGDELVSAIIGGFMDRKSDNMMTVGVPIYDIVPGITRERLKQLDIRGIVSSFKTKFDTGDTPRVDNIKRASQLINNTILMPGDEFSFNDIVGPRTKARGFFEAKEIVDNEYVIGVGGGVCQVSSTLYNAVVYGGLDILERRPHSKISGYIQPGRDATVYYNAIDLRFVNNLDRPVMVVSEVTGDALQVGLLSDPSRYLNVKLTSKTVETLSAKVMRIEDDTLEPGEEIVEETARDGIIVETYRSISTSDGIPLRNELLSRDIYPPVDGRIRVGLQPDI